MAHKSETTGEHYSLTARFAHWLTVAFIAVLVPVGLFMTYRGKELNLWDDLTNTLYSGHKLAGFILLWLIVARLGYRLFAGAPADEPTLTGFHKFASHAVHWAMYGLLIAIPILGWIGVSAFPALQVFGGASLPAITGPDRALAEQVFELHGLLARLLMALIALHIAAALYHHFIRRDGVLRRMIGSRPASEE